MQEYRKDRVSLAKHPLLSRVSVFTGKTLVIVHENDEIVPRQTTDAYINAFGADSVIAKGFSHSVIADTLHKSQLEEYEDSISNWLNKAVVQ